MSEVLIYKTKEGVRWDTVAFEAYGDANRMNEIIAANPDVDISEKIPGGIELQIPVVQVVAATVSNDLLPPWKRNL